MSSFDALVKEVQHSVKKFQPPPALEYFDPSSPIFDLLTSIKETAFGPILEHQKIVDFANQVRERQERERLAFIKSGWWFTPSIMQISARKLNTKIHQYHNGDPQAIYQLFRSFYQRNNWQRLSNTVQQWYANPLFVPWRKHIQDALEAHMNSKYTLSIPTLLLISEGIAEDFCTENNISFKPNQGDDKFKKAISNYYQRTEHLLLPRLDILTHSIDTLIYQNTWALGPMLNSNILNRHAVLHGKKKNYARLKPSLQAFMLLDVLSELH